MRVGARGSLGIQRASFSGQFFPALALVIKLEVESFLLHDNHLTIWLTTHSEDA